MSAIYDNWERLVAAVLFHQQSTSPTTSSSSSSSDFSFSRPNSSFEDLPFGYSSPKWAAYNHKNDATKLFRRRNLTIQVPKPEIEDWFSHGPVFSEYCSRIRPTLSPRVNRDDAKQESYPLPLPPTPTSNSLHVSPLKLAEKLLSPPSRSPQGAEKFFKIPGTSWRKGKLIGKGPLGDVYIGFNSERGQMCAMKEVSLSSKDAESKKNARTLEKEIAILSRLNHPSIVQYYGSDMVADNFYIYFEFVSGGSINMILQQYGRLGESVISNYTQQILSGLAYLHSKGVAHRDIKGASVLVDPNGKVKLCHFAFEKHIAEQYRVSWLTESCYWMAPEAITNSNEHKLAVDIWSLGCTVLEMATARPPLSQYDRDVVMFKIANHKELPQIPDHLSDVCKDFLRHCLQWDPLHRATASQLLEHPFVKSSWPLGKQILVSTSSAHPAGTNASKSKGADHARSPHQLDSAKVISRASKASKSNFKTSDIYTPRIVSPVRSRLPQPRSTSVSPVGSPLPHPRSTPVSTVESPLPHPRSAPVSPVESRLVHPQHLSDIYTPRIVSAPVSPVRSRLPQPRLTSVSPVGSPLPHPRSTPVSPVESPLPLPRSAPVSPVESRLVHPQHLTDIYTSRNISAPVSPVGSCLSHPRSATVSPVGSPLPHPSSTPVSSVGSPLPHPRSAPVSPIESRLPHPQHLNRLISPSCPHTPSKLVIPHSPLNQSLLGQEDTSYNLPKFKTPSYWDPNILQVVFKFP